MDPAPGGGFRGWADRLAEMLTTDNPDLLYANLAIRGRKLPQIRAEQLEAAIELEPDLASVLGGVNDILRPRVETDQRIADLETIVARLRETGATVLVFNYPDLASSLRIAPARVTERVRLFNRTIGEIADRHGASLVDLENDEIQHPGLWSSDRLHASPVGHERMAALAADRLGVANLAESWTRQLEEPAPQRLPIRIAGEAVWAGRHLAPWVLRRLRGVSSGDGLEPKRPTLQPVTPAVATD